MNRLQHQGKQLENKKLQKAQQANLENTFKPKIAKSSEILANERKKKVAQKMGIQPEQFENMNIDKAQFLRAQGELINQTKEEKAKRAIAQKMKTECTFTPNTNKKPFLKKVAQQIQSDDRTSVGSINLDGIAKKRDTTDDVFEQASSLKKSIITSETVRGKHD